MPNNSGGHDMITTISSPYVRKEIKWALDVGSTIIFVCHNRYSLPMKQGNLDDETWSIIQALGTKQGIFIDKESAEEYEFAVMKLLNGLGYATY